jgi:hypothetical protein
MLLLALIDSVLYSVTSYLNNNEIPWNITAIRNRFCHISRHGGEEIAKDNPPKMWVLITFVL